MNDRPNFPGVRVPTSDFRAVATDLQTGPLMYEVDLASARSIGAGTALILKIAGNALYVDQASDVGNGTLIFQDDSNIRPARVFVAAGFNYRGPWTQLIIENTAQAGKTLRFFYGVDIDFQPGLNAQVQIAGTVAVQEQGIAYAAAFASSAALAAATAQNAIAAAANTGGYVAWAANINSRNAGTAFIDAALLAKATAPASVVDGDVLVDAGNQVYAAAAVSTGMGKLVRAVRVAAGKRADFISTGAETSGSRSLLYTLL